MTEDEFIKILFSTGLVCRDCGGDVRDGICNDCGRDWTVEDFD